VPSRWRLESLTMGPMEYEADITFWNAALRDFPRFPHLTKFRLIHHYCMPEPHNIFRRIDLPDEDHRPTQFNLYFPYNVPTWTRFGSIISNRDMFPLLEVVDACPTYGSRVMDPRRLSYLFSAPGARLTHWGNDWTYVDPRARNFISAPESFP